MAETNARIMDMVRREIDKDPSVSSEQLYELAKKSDSSIGSLSVRQFHARYPLQVKRAATNARKARSAARKTGARRGRPPGKTTGRGGRKAAKRGAGEAATGGAAKKARRGRPPGSGRKATAKRAAGKRGPGRRPGRPRRTAGAGVAPAGPGRDQVRALLLQFARDIAAAEGKADVVEVIGEVDRWVDRLMAAAS